MTGRVARHNYDSSSLDKLSTKSLPLPHYLDSKSSHRARKSFLHSSSGSLNYSPREHLSSLIEEDITHSHSGRQRASPTEWNYLVNEDEPRSSSPTASITSGNSSPSEVGDSGVCSEHDTPPPRSRLSQRHHLLSSDSDNESSVSSDSMHDLHRSGEEHDHNDMSYSVVPSIVKQQNYNNGQKRRVRHNFIPHRIRLPDSLLREICEKSRQMKKRRQMTWRDSGGVEGSIPPSADRNHLNSRSGRNYSSSRRNSYSNIHALDQSTLSLAASSRFSSTNSLFIEEDSFNESPSSAFYNITDSSNRSLFECLEKGAGIGFAGLKDIYSLQQQESTIRSYKGTVRGVKNRVRAGIATFMSDHQNLKVSYIVFPLSSQESMQNYPEIRIYYAFR